MQIGNVSCVYVFVYILCTHPRKTPNTCPKNKQASRKINFKFANTIGVSVAVVVWSHKQINLIMFCFSVVIVTETLP